MSILHDHGLLGLSPKGSDALATALGKLPVSPDRPTEVAERIAQLLDVVMPLTRREDLCEEDQEILLAFCMSDRRLLSFATMLVEMEATLRARL